MKNNTNTDDLVDLYLEDEIPVKRLQDKTNTLLEDLSGTNLGYLLQKIQTTNNIPDLFIFVGLIKSFGIIKPNARFGFLLFCC